MQGLFVFVSQVFDPVVLLVALMVLVGLLVHQRQRMTALVVFLLAIGNGIGFGLKELIQRPRPLDPLILETGYSFPSGHAFGTTLFACALLYVAGQVYGWRGPKLTVLAVCLGLWVLLMAYARVYLRVHFVSDVIGGIVIASLWSVLVVVWSRRRRSHYTGAQL